MTRIGYPFSALDSQDVKRIASHTKHGIRTVKRALSDEPGHRSAITAEVRRVAADLLASPSPAMRIRLAHAKRLERLHESTKDETRTPAVQSASRRRADAGDPPAE